MLLSRSQPPLRTALASIGRSAGSGNATTCLNEAFGQLAIKSNGLALGLGSVRYAHHKAQGAVNKAKDGPGKRLGAKKSGEQYVIPGNIIFRQRGTHWFPGDNCAMGRDHTIYATEHGYVKYYKDPNRNPKKQYIGVVFKREQVLPLPPNSMRRRKLNMVAQKMPTVITPSAIVRTDAVPETASGETTKTEVTVVGNGKAEEPAALKMRPGGMYRESNWEIGRAAERAKIQVREFKPRDRWVAWRKASIRNKGIQDKKSMGRKKGKK